jgi:hypothetical protein
MTIDKKENIETTMSSAFAEAKTGSSQPQGAAAPREESPARGVDRFRRPLPRFSAGAEVGKYHSALKEALNESNSSGALQPLSLTILDGAGRLPLSAVILSWVEQNVVATATLLIEASGSMATSHQVEVSGQRVDNALTAGDLQSDYLNNMVREKLAPQYPADVTFMEAAVITVPREVNPEDHGRIRQILVDTVTSLIGVLDLKVGTNEAPFNVDDLKAEGDTISAKVEFNPGTTEDSCGNLARTDIAINLSGQANKHDQAFMSQQTKLTDVTGMMDIVYSPSDNGLTQDYNQVQNAAASRSYKPRFVITGVTHNTNVVTLELHLLALATAAIVNQDHNWAQAWLPQYGLAKGTDIRDIGALGLEVPLMGDGKLNRVPTKGDDFGPSELMGLLNLTMHPELVTSWDIAETGPYSWLQSLFLAAANGAAKAEERIFNACNNLTNGMFQKVWTGEPIFVGEVDRVALGHYPKDGSLADIRDIDYLAMLNLVGDRDPQAVIDFADTYADASTPEPLRLQRREQILTGIIDGYRITGYARRVNFNAKFLPALATACSQAGANIRPEGVQTGMRAGQRATGNWGSASADSSRSGLFNAQYGNQRSGWNGNQTRNMW